MKMAYDAIIYKIRGPKNGSYGKQKEPPRVYTRATSIRTMMTTIAHCVWHSKSNVSEICKRFNLPKITLI